MNSKLIGWILGLSAIAGLHSCTTPPSEVPSKHSSTKPKVVVTTSILCDLTQHIAADTLDLTCLLKPGTDAHIYQPLPADRRAIEDAQLILYSGYHLEPNLEPLIQANTKNIPKIAVAEQAVSQPLQGHAEESEPHSATHSDASSHADAHADAPDPHVWQNAQHGAAMTTVIQKALIQLVPANAQQYQDRAQSITQELRQIDQWIKTQIATIPVARRKLVTTHDAFGYYAAAYGIPVETALQGVSTEEKPSATRIKALVEIVKRSKVPTIFVEASLNPTLMQTIAQEAQVKIAQQELFSDSLGAVGSPGATYVKMLQSNTQTLVEGLGGQYTPFQKAGQQ